ncbi:hypothetical protein RP20_CCG005747 [Aedes albopictus]|nr:hypothetical protein RP20_CCG005747 [Aedes albopictus]
MKLTFVGYSDCQKAYRFVDLATNKVYHSRDVRFLNEGKLLQISLKSSGVMEYESVLEPSSPNEPNTDHADEDFEADDMQSTSEEEESFLDCSQGIEMDDQPVLLPEPSVRRSERSTKELPPIRYSEIVDMVKPNVPEPRTIKEALDGPESELWKAAIEEELQSHKENCTWNVVPLPSGRITIGCKWIFKRRMDESGKVVRYKARLVAQGFTQKIGTDYDEVFAPVVKQVTFRTLLSVAHQRNMLIKHMDVKTAYLNGELQETVFMKPPPGCDFGNQNLVCHLQKGLYGLKEAANIWNKKLNSILRKLGFKPSENDPCLYSKRNSDGTMAYIAVYVDDLIIVCKSEEEYENVFKNLNNNLKVTSLGDVTHFLGIHVTRSQDGVSLNQKAYIQKLLT